jgi:hypothetical protein
VDQLFVTSSYFSRQNFFVSECEYEYDFCTSASEKLVSRDLRNHLTVAIVQGISEYFYSAVYYSAAPNESDRDLSKNSYHAATPDESIPEKFSNECDDDKSWNKLMMRNSPGVIPELLASPSCRPH